jgi:flagellar motility protein MotE (MotC chaperone)
MSQGYDQFFKKAKANKQNSPERTVIRPKKTKSTATKPLPAQAAVTDEQLRQALRVKPPVKTRPRQGFPVMAFLVAIIGFSAAAVGYFCPEKMRELTDRVSIGVFSDAFAAGEGSEKGADKAKAEGAAAKSAEAKGGDAEKSAGGTKGQGKSECAEMKGFTEEEMSHFNKLNDRKKELDLREAELNALEEELHKQKSEVETRIAKLEQIREDVAKVLKDRVEVDQQRVSTLVEFYQNMKPKQAADIFAKLNEDLAIEVLGKMKKKTAADILNLLEPAKARALSEKFTGYKRD